MRVVLTNAKLYTPFDIVGPATVVIENSRVKKV